MTPLRFQWRGTTSPQNVEDFRDRARRALPEMVWTYLEYGAEDLVTLDANRSAFDRYRLRSRVLPGAACTDLGVTIGGQQLSAPILLAPTGLVGLVHWRGELGAAQGAERAGTLAITSTAATYSFSEVAAGTTRPHFAQLYAWADPVTGSHELTDTLVTAARNAGAGALVVTVDVPVPGNRERERRRGMGNPPVVTPRRIVQGALKPRWAAGVLRHRRIAMKNLVDAVGLDAVASSLNLHQRMTRPELSWSDLEWVRARWPGVLYVKGVLDADDAARMVDLGADGVIVSNHGGRQLDGAVATLDALPAIAARVGDRSEVLLDGGIRRGSDIVKALCLGAKAVCLGRSFLYGMAADGPRGVTSVVNLLRDEMSRTLTLAGVRSLRDLNREMLVPRETAIPPARSRGVAE
jgi:isopentenyl diphosphate isomerase/L-lactate dehydrogenase-like FMN-dependent dehydrogenase